MEIQLRGKKRRKVIAHVPGRTPKGVERQRTRTLIIRLTDEERRRLELLALHHPFDGNVSAFVRDVIDAEYDYLTETDPQWVRRAMAKRTKTKKGAA